MPTPVGIWLQRLLMTPITWEANRHAAKWRKAVRHGPRAQQRVLDEIMALVAGSDFARDYGLDRVRTIDDLRRALPVAGYERVEPYVERVARGEIRAMFARGVKLPMFALTSGTTGPAKWLPVTDALLRTYRRGWHVWGTKALADHFDAFGARFLQIVSRVDEQIAPSGTPVGSMSGLTAKGQRRLVRRLYATPAEAAYAGNTGSKYYLACRAALRHRRVMPLTANPSTFIALAQEMDRRKEELIRDVADGTLAESVALDPDRRAAVERSLKPDPRRAQELDAVVRRTGRLVPKDVWELPLIGCWKGGTLELYLRRMPQYWGDAPVRDIGLLASEGRISIPQTTNGSAGMLDLAGMVFELIPEEEAGGEHPATILPHEAETGRKYTLVLTTLGGLFRYNIGDVVEVTEMAGPVPVVRFLCRGTQTANLTGEKLTEHQVTRSVNAALAALDVSAASYCLCPTWDDPPYYSLLVEEDVVDEVTGARLAREVDKRLTRHNIEYLSKRSSGRLGPVRVKTTPAGTWETYDREAIAAASGRAEQYKHKFLQRDVDFQQRFTICACYGTTETT